MHTCRFSAKLSAMCVGVFTLFLMIGGSSVSAYDQKITTLELKDMLGKPDLVILDVRDELNWSKACSRIQGALHENPSDVRSWFEKYSKDKPIVLYCNSPFEKNSSRVALQLSAMGFSRVLVLKGGWFEWERAKLPVESK